MEVSDSIHVVQDTSSEETRDDVGNGVAGMPYRHAHWILFFGVPR